MDVISRLQFTMWFLVFTSIIASCTNSELLDKRLNEIVGDTPIDCGTVGVQEDASLASECAQKAFSVRRAFVVRYALQGIDSKVMVALAGTDSGRVYAIEYDSLGWSPRGLGKHARLMDGNHNVVQRCPSPIRLMETSSHRLTCFPPDTKKAKGNIMSPIVEPY